MHPLYSLDILPGEANFAEDTERNQPHPEGGEAGSRKQAPSITVQFQANETPGERRIRQTPSGRSRPPPLNTNLSSWINFEARFGFHRGSWFHGLSEAATSFLPSVPAPSPCRPLVRSRASEIYNGIGLLGVRAVGQPRWRSAPCFSRCGVARYPEAVTVTSTMIKAPASASAGTKRPRKPTATQASVPKGLAMPNVAVSL